jgi:hypothetical protein
VASAQLAKSVTIVTLPNDATARELSKAEPSDWRCSRSRQVSTIVDTEPSSRQLSKTASVAKCHIHVTPLKRSGGGPPHNPTELVCRWTTSGRKVATIVATESQARELAKAEPPNPAGPMQLPPKVFTMVNTERQFREPVMAAPVAKGHHMVTSERRIQPNGQKDPPRQLSKATLCPKV